MSLKKVVFHPLERLDLIDIEGLQDLSHDATADFIGGVMGANSAGVLKPWTSSSVSDNVISFGDFTFLGRGSDTDGSGNHSPAFMGKFRSTLSGNTECDLSSFTAIAQSYYDTNGVLPAEPDNASFSILTHGPYFPYIYCRPVVSEGVEGVRRFWSAGDNNEVTNTVNTRTTVHFEFALASILDSAPTADSGFGWTRIGLLKRWRVSGGVVSFQNIDVRPWTIADSMMNLSGSGLLLSNLTNVSSLGGLSAALSWVTHKLNQLQTDGSLDDDDAVQTPQLEQPPYSLAGLKFLHDELQAQVDAVPTPTHSSLIVNIAWPGGDYPVLSFSADTRNDFTLTPHLDFKPARKYILDQTGTNVDELGSSEWSTYFQQTPSWATLLNSIALEVPLANAGGRYQLTVQPIFSDAYDAENPYLVGGSTGSAARYRAVMGGQNWQALTPTTADRNKLNSVLLFQRQTQSSNTDISFYGIKIGERGLDDTAFGNLSLNDVFTFRLRISLTLYRT